MVQVNKIFVPQDADSVTKLIKKKKKIQIKLSPESDKIDLKEKNLVHYVQFLREGWKLKLSDETL